MANTKNVLLKIAAQKHPEQYAAIHNHIQAVKMSRVSHNNEQSVVKGVKEYHMTQPILGKRLRVAEPNDEMATSRPFKKIRLPRRRINKGSVKALERAHDNLLLRREHERARAQIRERDAARLQAAIVLMRFACENGERERQFLQLRHGMMVQWLSFCQIWHSSPLAVSAHDRAISNAATGSQHTTVQKTTVETPLDASNVPIKNEDASIKLENEHTSSKDESIECRADVPRDPMIDPTPSTDLGSKHIPDESPSVESPTAILKSPTKAITKKTADVEVEDAISAFGSTSVKDPFAALVDDMSEHIKKEEQEEWTPFVIDTVGEDPGILRQEMEARRVSQTHSRFYCAAGDEKRGEAEEDSDEEDRETCQAEGDRHGDRDGYIDGDEEPSDLEEEDYDEYEEEEEVDYDADLLR